MTPEEIYTELKKLIALLKVDGNEKLATTLEHRMYKVTWTSSSELLETISFILTDYVGDNIDITNSQAAEQAKFIITEIKAIVRD